MKRAFIFFSYLLASCVTTDLRYIDLNYTTSDDPDNGVISVQYKNSGPSNVCVGPENWPTSDGVLNTDGSTVYIVVEAKKYYLNSLQDYCPKCAIKVESGRSVEGRLKYVDFELPKSKYFLPKSLHFKPVGYTCN